MVNVKEHLRQRLSLLRKTWWFRESLLFLRGACFLGKRFKCPCCQWRVRGFLGRTGWSLQNADGYCPRCNSKARHRRLWRFLQQNPEFLQDGTKILDVGPAPAISRILTRRDDLAYVAVDIDAARMHLSAIGDIRALPFASCTFDIVLCQHVLEHIEDDQKSIAELQRVVTESGRAIISVPLRVDQPTYEDPTVTDPSKRKELFGEPGHVRFYGFDLAERLQDAGFASSLRRASEISSTEREFYGLRDDEHLFECQRL